MRRRVIDSTEASPAPRQIVKPCSDCPWRRDSAGAWLGPSSSYEWIEMAHGEERVVCHVHPNVQCAGIAIYRANVCKLPKDRTLLRLPADRENVFASRFEFFDHHKKPSL